MPTADDVSDVLEELRRERFGDPDHDLTPRPRHRKPVPQPMSMDEHALRLANEAVAAERERARRGGWDREVLAQMAADEASGMRQVDIAAKYGVSQSWVSTCLAKARSAATLGE